MRLGILVGCLYIIELEVIHLLSMQHIHDVFYVYCYDENHIDALAWRL